jgi:hypothetical protein
MPTEMPQRRTVSKQQGRTRARTVTDQPSLLARIERAIYRLAAHARLAAAALGRRQRPGGRAARLRPTDHLQIRRVLCELREAVLEQVGKDQTDRLRHALADAVKALSA